MIFRILKIVILFCVFNLDVAFAQSSNDSSAADVTGGGNYEVGIEIGSLLPHQVGSNLTEIMGLGGIRAGTRIANQGWFEGSLVSGNGSGQEWRNAAADLRMDIPVENLVGVATLGLDLAQFKGPGGKKQMDFGGHVGGGIEALLGGGVWLRTDMKFGFSPGTYLYIDLGFTWRFGDGAGGGT